MFCYECHGIFIIHHVQDYAESVDALKRAIQVVAAADKKIPVELVQRVANDIPAARSTLESFIEEKQPQANKEVYSFQGSIFLLDEYIFVLIL